jgi:conjugal transfer pilus assembly protein TraD
VSPDPVGDLPGLLMAGAVAGGVAAPLLRWRGWRFEWPLLGAPIAAALSLADRDSALLVGWACLVGLLSGARRHWRELQVGGDVALRARQRIGVPAAARHRLALRTVVRGRALSPDGLLLGRDRLGGVRIPMGGFSGVHTLVVGATGSGKTVTQAWIAAHAIAAGHAAIVIDPKGDDALRQAVKTTAQLSGARFQEWTPEGPCVYNPYARGSDTELADKLLAGEDWSEPHYLRQAQRYLRWVIEAVRSAGRPLDLATIVKHFPAPELELLSRHMNGRGSTLQRYLDSMSPAEVKQLAGARDRLAILAESDLSPWITLREDVPVIDLADVIATGSVAYFKLESDRWPLAGQMLAAALVGDLIALTAERQHAPIPTFVVLDEFGALGAAQVARLFQRGRSAGLSLLLGAQEITTLAVTHEELLKDVLGNATTVIAHRQGVPESAELIADLAGTEGTWVTTRRTDHIGDTEHGTRSRAYQYVLHPDRLKHLTTGQAAVIVPGHHTATIAQIFHDPTLAQEPRYDPELFDVEAGWAGVIDEGPPDAGAR